MFFVGTDIISIKRLEKIILKKGKVFLNHAFTEYEQKICDAKNTPVIHYSGKFAAKEAVKKAILSSHIKKSISLTSIEIRNSSNGSPYTKMKNKLPCLIHISISHTKKYATAIAILEIK